MAKFIQNELNDEELGKVNGGVEVNNKLRDGYTLLGTNSGTHFTYQVANGKAFDDFQTWALGYWEDDMTPDQFDAVIFAKLSDPATRPSYVTKLDAPIKKP